MSGISLALCIPTYERDEIVEDFLIKCSAYYIRAGIDIYYYDSSVSDKTKNVVCGWADQEHIHYVRLPSDLDGNTKAYRIFQGYELKKEYDFIWLSNDGLQCKETAIAQLMSSLSLDYDIVEINHTDHEKIGNRVLTDPNEYLQMCAWHLGLFGAAILNRHTMLNGVDWAFYEEKFLTPTLISWSHVSFYFYRILELERFCALHLSVSGSQISESKLKKDIGWRDQMFSVVCERWVQTIMGLPDFYTNKESACVKLGDLSLLREIEWFYHFRKKGFYSLKVYHKYHHVWSNVTSIPRAQLLVAACTPKSLIKLHEKIYKTMRLAKLRKFCKSHPRIMIYGTGGTGAIYDQYFKKEGLHYEAFCVSHRKPDKAEYLQHPVYEFDEIKHASKEIGYVFALVAINVEDVLTIIGNSVDKSHIFYEPGLVKIIRRENGYSGG